LRYEVVVGVRQCLVEVGEVMVYELVLVRRALIVVRWWVIEVKVAYAFARVWVKLVYEVGVMRSVLSMGVKR
jgi:hypothetical protein